MTTLDLQSTIRSLIDIALKPEKITVWVAQILAHANIAIGNSGTIGR